MVDNQRNNSGKITDKAIALNYDMGEDQAPKVVAKGEGEVAKQIIKIAKENGIEIREDADLAEILSAIEIDEFIPLEAYTAVAEILKYIYKKSDKSF